MATLALLLASIGACVALLIGILVFSEISEAIDCEAVLDNGFSNQRMADQCNSAKDTAFLVIAILPIALFFAMFSIFGGLSGGTEDDDEPTNRKHDYLYGSAKTETKKERQKRKQAEVDRQLEQYDDKVVHSFLTNWFRGKKEQ